MYIELSAHTEGFLIVFDFKIFVPDMTPEPFTARRSVFRCCQISRLADSLCVYVFNAVMGLVKNALSLKTGAVGML
jgi:hypothetical protein